MNCPRGAICPAFVAAAGEELRDVWGTAPNEIWAVGHRAGDALVAHFDGVRWTTNTLSGRPPLESVWGRSPTEYWAVGGDSTVVRFNGTNWIPVALPADAGLQFTSVFGGTPPTVWVTHRFPSPINVYEWQGGTWAARSGLSFGAYAVYAFAGDAWVVGDEFGLVHRWNGSTFNPVSSMSPVRLRAVTGLSNTEVWAAGDNRHVLRQNNSTGTWDLVSSGAPDSGELVSLWMGRPDELWIGGVAGYVARAQVDGGSILLNPLDSGVAGNVNGIWGSSPDDVYFAADRAVLRWQR